jgi:four helix bundle protein
VASGDPKNDLRERTKSFALRIIRMFSALPKKTEAQVLGRQVLRSGTSVGANYREAFRARSKPEFISKCGDCLKEVEETAYWLELLVEAELVAAKKLAPSAAGMRGADGHLRFNYQKLEASAPFLNLNS